MDSNISNNSRGEGLFSGHPILEKISGKRIDPLKISLPVQANFEWDYLYAFFLNRLLNGRFYLVLEGGYNGNRMELFL